MKRTTRRPSPATAISVLALFVSLSGVTYAATVVPRNSVASTSIRQGAVTRPKLRNRAVSQSKLAPAAVGTTRLADRAVTAGKLAPGAVGAAQLAAGAVGAPQLAASSVGGPAVADGALGTADLATGAVTGAKVADGSLTGADIDVGSLGVVRSIVLRQDLSPVTTVGPQSALTATATCLPGERAVGGSGSTNNVPLMLDQQGPVSRDTGWQVTFANWGTTAVPVAQVVAYATCVTP